jgi:hypothetical protein
MEGTWDQYEHPEIKKLEMGYVPSVESRLKLYDGIEIDLIILHGLGLGVDAALC